MTDEEQALKRSRLAKFLGEHLEQLERDYHRTCPEFYCKGTFHAMQEVLAAQITEIKYLLRDIPNIEFHEPVR